MFAVIKTGGKQYRVAEGDVFKTEILEDAHKQGDKVTFGEVLLRDSGTATNVGSPFLSGVKVEGEVVEMGRGKKIRVIHYKAKSNRFKRAGHRQPFVKVKITKVS